MMFRGRLLTGIVLAVVIAGGLGLATAQIFPTASQTTTTTSTMVSSATSSSVTTITSTSITTATSTATVTSAAVSTSLTATSVSTATVATTTFVTTETSTASSVTSTSSACETEYCGELVLMSPSLSPENSTSAYAALTFTLLNSGNLNITTISISVNGVLGAQVRGVSAYQTVTYLIQLAPSFDVVAGQTYQVEVASTTPYGTGPSTGFSVVAQ